MATLPVTFENIFIGSGLTASKDDWFDIGALAGINSPIPSGRYLWLGYATFACSDKNLIFEIRANNAGVSTATAGSTSLRGYANTDPTSGSANVDMYMNGNILMLAPIVAPSTGVEKLWLRTRSGTNTAANFDYMIFYTLY